MRRSPATCRARATASRRPSISSNDACSRHSTAPSTVRSLPMPGRSRRPMAAASGGEAAASLYAGPGSSFRSIGMDATALRAMQAPLKDRYKSDPKSATITLKAKGSLDDTSIACKVETGRALAVAGLHPATGGSGMELCSGDMLLEALVACAGVTLKAVATALAIPLESATVSAEGDLDFRGTLGMAKEAPVSHALRRHHRRAARQARSIAQAHRALLRRLSDDTQWTAGRHHTRAHALTRPQ